MISFYIFLYIFILVLIILYSILHIFTNFYTDFNSILYQTVWLPRLMALVRLICLGFYSILYHFTYFYIGLLAFYIISHIFIHFILVLMIFYSILHIFTNFYTGFNSILYQTVWLPRLMALVRLIYLGFLENLAPPHLYIFYMFLHIAHLFLL